MKLLAIHKIIRKPKDVEPGQVFDAKGNAEEGEAAELLALGAASVPSDKEAKIAAVMNAPETPAKKTAAKKSSTKKTAAKKDDGKKDDDMLG